MNDAELFRAWKEKPSQEALIALLNVLGKSAHALSFHVLGHVQDAEDVAQKVLMELVKALPTFPDADRLRGWLYRTSILSALSLKRSGRRRMRYERTPKPGNEPSLSEEQKDEIHRRIAELDDHLRRVVVQHYFESRTLAELSADAHCSTGAIWKRIQKAHDELRRALAGAGTAGAVVAFLESRKAEAAVPPTLPSRVIERAAEAGRNVASRHIPFGVWTAVLTTAAGILLGLGVYVRSQPVAAPRASEPKLASERPREIVRQAPLPPPAAAAGDAEAEEPTATFRSGAALVRALKRAIALPDPVARWKELRRIGVRRTFDEVRTALDRAVLQKGAAEPDVAALRHLLLDWLSSDTPGAAAFIKGLPDDETINGYLVWTLGWAAREWGKSDPASAIALLKGLPSYYSVSELAVPIELEARFRSDPDAFVAWIRALPAKARDRQEALRIAAPWWIEKDPRAALTWVEQQQPYMGEMVRRAALESWKCSGPWMEKCALALQSRKCCPDAAKAVAEEFLLGIEESDPTWTDEKRYRWESQVFQPLVVASFAQRAAENPVEAARFAESVTFDSWSLLAEQAVASAWGEKDPRAALDWLQKRPFSSMHAQTACEIVGQWAARDREEATRASQNISGPLRSSALAKIFAVWFSSDPPAALQFARSLPEPLPDPALGRLAGSWAARDLEAALSWTRGLPRAEARNDGLGAIAVAVADDLEKAKAIAGEITDAEYRKVILERVLVDKSIDDPAAVAKELERMPEYLPATVQQVAQRFSNKDPLAGLTWAQGLPPEYSANALRTIVLTGGVRRNPEGTKAWIEKSSLPAELKTELLERIRRSVRK